MTALPARHLATPHEPEPSPPREPLSRLFGRFLRFGLLAWGGPVAQIDMLRKDLVEDERWISRERFNRVLSVYQVLPGPEAHELCVYFGMIARGRIGGLLAGLGFMLPGAVFMFVLSWLYMTYGITSFWEGALRGLQAGVIALIVRASHRIAGHALIDRWLVGIAIACVAASLAGVHFAITLPVAGLSYVLIRQHRRVVALALGSAFVVGVIVYVTHAGGLTGLVGPTDGRLAETARPVDHADAPLGSVVASGLRAGLLTFGGAYTVIPFLQRDAVEVQGWMTNGEFLTGIALSGILPAPLIIFATFVGYLAGGAVAAVAITAAIFAPAFAFTLLGHDQLERAVQNPRIRTFLDGVTAGVVGLIGATTIALAMAALADVRAVAIAAVALVMLYLWHAKVSVPVAVLASGALGFALFR